MSVSLRRKVLTLAALTAAPLMVRYPALADQSSVTVVQSSVPSIAPGSAGRVDLAATNAGPSASFSTLTFTAPTGTTFADTDLFLDGRQVTSVSCSLADGAATLSCADDAALEFPANSTTEVGVDLQVPSGAAAASTLGGGSLSVPSVSSGTWSFAVSTAQNGAVDSGNLAAASPAAATAGTAAATTDAAGADATPGTDATAATGAAPATAAAPATDAAGGDSATNLVPDAAPGTEADPGPDPDPDPDQPWGGDDHHCKCGPGGGVGSSAPPYVVRMLATEFIRPTPSTTYAPIGSEPAGAYVNVTCKVNGQVIDGNPHWYSLFGRSGWISARWATNIGPIPPFC